MYEQLRKVMKLAYQEAQRFNHACVGTEHVLLALLREDAIFKNLDIDTRKIRIEIEKLVQIGPYKGTTNKTQTPRVKKAIEYSIEEASSLKHEDVKPEHILVGLLRESSGVAANVLMNFGLKLEEVRSKLFDKREEDELPNKRILDCLRIKYDNQWDRMDIVWESDASLPEKYGKFTLLYSEIAKNWGGCSIPGIHEIIANSAAIKAKSELTPSLKGTNGQVSLSDFLKYTSRRKFRKFKPYALYCDKTDSLNCYWVNSNNYTEWVNHHFEIQREMKSNLILGISIKNLMGFMKEGSSE